MTFAEYLIDKKIDEELFQQGEPGRWQEFRALFAQMHPESFTTQKKFLINDIRRRYQLKVAPAPPPAAPKPAVVRPSVKIAQVPAPLSPDVPITEAGAPSPVNETPAAEPKPAARPVIKRPAAVIRKPPEGREG